MSASGAASERSGGAGLVGRLVHPLFDGVRPRHGSGDADDLDSLNARLEREPATRGLRFVAQTPELLADGLHYEERIADRGLVATREGSLHDLFNAWTWLQHPAIKRAMNARQAADIARTGPRQRTRGQCALTHFDEAGAIVWISDDDLVRRWDAHDWTGLFSARRGAWGAAIAVTVIGHALLEYAIEHDAMPVAKALAIAVGREEIAARSSSGATIGAWPAAEQRIAAAIRSGVLLADPQELRPLPLAGLPGWHAAEQSAQFYASAPCFRPLREGRRYPLPFALTGRSAGFQNVKTATRAAVCACRAPGAAPFGNFS